MAAKYVKLGKKARAGSFYESNSQVSLYGDKIQKINITAFNHPRVRRAIQAGHVIVVTEEDYNEWKKENEDKAKKDEAKQESLVPKSKVKKSKEEDLDQGEYEEEDEEEDEDEVDYMELNKGPLVDYALTLEGMEFTSEELSAMTKSEIQAEIADLLEQED